MLNREAKQYNFYSTQSPQFLSILFTILSKTAIAATLGDPQKTPK